MNKRALQYLQVQQLQKLLGGKTKFSHFVFFFSLSLLQMDRQPMIIKAIVGIESLSFLQTAKAADGDSGQEQDKRVPWGHSCKHRFMERLLHTVSDGLVVGKACFAKKQNEKRKE